SRNHWNCGDIIYSGKSFSQSGGTIRRIHFILAGNASVETHLAGITKIGADEVVIFSHSNDDILTPLSRTLQNMGVEYRKRELGFGYLDTFQKASEEAIASLTSDCAIAINMSTAQCVELSALEDAIRVQVHFVHERNDKAYCSGYRYYVRTIHPLKLEAIPFWNFQNQTHNDTLEILASMDHQVGLKELLDLVKNTREDVEGYEGFCSIFRWFLVLNRLFRIR
ncbi:MAG: hypothetical protein ACREBS_05330, partial [Nitrososphaerales archaeon]